LALQAGQFNFNPRYTAKEKTFEVLIHNVPTTFFNLNPFTKPRLNSLLKINIVCWLSTLLRSDLLKYTWLHQEDYLSGNENVAARPSGALHPDGEERQDHELDHPFDVRDIADL
jgi:hypothetical protein